MRQIRSAEARKWSKIIDNSILCKILRMSILQYGGLSTIPVDYCKLKLQNNFFFYYN